MSDVVPTLTFLNLFLQLHTDVTNDCAFITKTLVTGVKLMTDKYKKYSH